MSPMDEVMQNNFNNAPHILVIDDSPEELRGIVGLLRQQPWRCLLYTSDAADE